MIPFHKSESNEKTIKYVNDVLDLGNFNDQGKYYSLSKEFLLDYTNSKILFLLIQLLQL